MKLFYTFKVMFVLKIPHDYMMIYELLFFTECKKVGCNRMFQHVWDCKGQL